MGPRRRPRRVAASVRWLSRSRRQFPRYVRQLSVWRIRIPARRVHQGEPGRSRGCHQVHPERRSQGQPVGDRQQPQGDGALTGSESEATRHGSHRSLLGSYAGRRDADRGDRPRSRRSRALRQGPLYRALRDFPAWRISAAAMLAELRGWTPIAAQQIEYSLVQRTPERELLPMALAFGLATVAWSPLGGGVLTGKYRRGETGRQTGMGGRLFHAEDTPQKTAIVDMLEAIAKETGSNAGRVAIAWVSAKGTIPIIGPRTRAQLDDNLAAVDVSLTADQIRRLDEVSAISLGFPHDLLASPATQDRIAGGKRALLDLPVRPVR